MLSFGRATLLCELINNTSVAHNGKNIPTMNWATGLSNILKARKYIEGPVSFYNETKTRWLPVVEQIWFTQQLTKWPSYKKRKQDSS